MHRPVPYFSIQKVRKPDQVQVQVEQESGQVCVRRRPAQLRTALPGDRESPLSSGCHDWHHPMIITRSVYLAYLMFFQLQYSGGNRSGFPGKL